MRDPKQPPLRGANRDPSARAPDDRRRILASLERGGAAAAEPPLVRWRLATGAAALLIALTGAVGWAALRAAAPPQIAPRLRAPEPTFQRESSAEPRRDVAATDMATTIAPPQPAVAAIINDTLAQSAAPRQSWLDAVPALAPPAPLSLPAPSSKTRPGKPHAAQAAHGRRVATRTPPAAPGPHQPAAKAPPPAAAAAPDSDVVLLTALVAHAGKQAAPLAKAPDPAAPDPDAGGSDHDVVLPRASETTESLLQRCKQLGFIEGMLCRSRICAGRPDSAACAK